MDPSVLGEIEQRLQELSSLKSGWDGDDAIPVKAINLRIARATLIALFSYDDIKDLPKPELGAVEDGRLDFFWQFGDTNVFCTLDENKIRIHGDKAIEDIPLEGDEDNQVKSLVKIFRNELLK